MIKTPSKYQQEIFDFVLHGAGNAFISSKAGSGKTTTMVEAMKLVPEKNKCIFLAFNKSIVQELQSRVFDHKNCDVSTVHSLGFSILRKEFGEISIDEFKYDSFLRKSLFEISTIAQKLKSAKIYNSYYSNIRKLVDISRLFLAQSSKEIKKLAAERGIDILYDENEVVEKTLSWGKENITSVDFTDMVWLPNELLLKPAKRYDWVFCDEVQDFSIAYYKLVKKCIKRGGRMFSVGDEMQTINGFAGASDMALNELKNAPNTKLFTLPICYRCDKHIIDLAKKRVPEISSRDDADFGNVLYDCSTDIINSGDLVLCRTKAPLAKLYITLLKRGKKCYINGGGMVSELIALLNDCTYDELNADVFSEGVFYSLYSNLLSLVERLVESKKIHRDDAMLSSQVLYMYDNISTLKILSDGCTTKKELLDRLNNINSYSGAETFTPNESNDGICLSTIHKSKGMECDKVFILCNPSLPPSDSMPQWEKEQELNLEYVAVTRAKHTLGFIGEKFIPKCGRQLSNQELLKELYTIEALVNNINGITTSITKYSFDAIKMKVEASLSETKDKVNLNIKTAQETKTKQKKLILDLAKYRKNED